MMGTLRKWQKAIRSLILESEAFEIIARKTVIGPEITEGLSAQEKNILMEAMKAMEGNDDD